MGLYIQKNLTTTSYPINGITYLLSEDLIPKFNQYGAFSKLIFDENEQHIIDIQEDAERKIAFEQRQQEKEKQEKEKKFNNKVGIPSEYESISVLAKMMIPQTISTLSIDTAENNDQKIKLSGLFENWTEGKYEIGDIRNANNQTWECFQAHDNSIYPDIKPDNPSWYTFWKPLHGKTPQTARKWVAPQGSHDIYKVGEYMWFTDYKLYKCIQQTNFSPTDYQMGWEVQE